MWSKRCVRVSPPIVIACLARAPFSQGCGGAQAQPASARLAAVQVMQMIRCMVGNGAMSWRSGAAERRGDAAFELGLVLLAEALVDRDDLAVRAHQDRAGHRL